MLLRHPIPSICVTQKRTNSSLLDNAVLSDKPCILVWRERWTVLLDWIFLHLQDLYRVELMFWPEMGNLGGKSKLIINIEMHLTIDIPNFIRTIQLPSYKPQCACGLKDLPRLANVIVWLLTSCPLNYHTTNTTIYGTWDLSACYAQVEYFI